MVSVGSPSELRARSARAEYCGSSKKLGEPKGRHGRPSLDEQSRPIETSFVYNFNPHVGSCSQSVALFLVDAVFPQQRPYLGKFPDRRVSRSNRSL
jgi:hypothetical protein